MLQTEVICCRSPDGNFLLEESDWSAIAREVHLESIHCRSSEGVRFLQKSGRRPLTVEARMETAYCRSSTETRKAIDHCRNLDGV